MAEMPQVLVLRCGFWGVASLSPGFQDVKTTQTLPIKKGVRETGDTKLKWLSGLLH